MDKNKKGFTNLSDLLKNYEEKEDDKYISREFQNYGLELAEELGDMKHKSLYIKLAKETSRAKMEAARRFVSDAENARNKAALFMWKLSQLKDSKANTHEQRRS